MTDVVPAVLDSFERNYRLERRARALGHLRKLYAPTGTDAGRRRLSAMTGGAHSADRIGSQLGERLVGAFLKSNVDDSWESYNEITPTTFGQQMALLLNRAEFTEIHTYLHRFLRVEDPAIREVVEARLGVDGEIGRADRNQFHGAAELTLTRARGRGVTFSVRGEHVAKVMLAEREAASGAVPIIELLKNERFVDINKHDQSKISLIVHDLVDHLWTMDLLDRKGLVGRFSDLFESIGNPLERDITSREGETIASIAFGVRYFRTMEPGLVPIVSAVRIGKLLEGACRHRDDPRLAEASEIVKQITTREKRQAARPSLESQSLAFVFSNYLTELNEQRRKHGGIKCRRGDSVEELSPFDPQYLAFFVLAHHELLTPKNKHVDTLARVHLMLEEFFMNLAAAELEYPYQRTLTLEDIAKFKAVATEVPHERVRWMFHNYGFTAAKEELV